MKHLFEAKKQIDKAVSEIQDIQNENEHLKILLFRMIKHHGRAIDCSEISEEQTEKLLKQGFYIDLNSETLKNN